jgi:hypothetical protein
MTAADREALDVELATTQKLVDQSRFMTDFAAGGKGVCRPVVTADYVLPTCTPPRGTSWTPASAGSSWACSAARTRST